MAKQLTHSQYLISIGGSTLAGLGLGEAACHLNHLCCVVVRMALEVLPTIILGAFEASEGLAFDYPRLLECLCQFASIWPLVVCLARAV